MWNIRLEKGNCEKQEVIYFAMGQNIKMQIPGELKMLLVFQTLVDISFIRVAVILIKSASSFSLFHYLLLQRFYSENQQKVPLEMGSRSKNGTG